MHSDPALHHGHEACDHPNTGAVLGATVAPHMDPNFMWLGSVKRNAVILVSPEKSVPSSLATSVG